MACGTRSVMDAVFGPITCGETTYARDLLARLPAGVLLLADRNFAAGHLFTLVAGSKGHLLVRAKTGRGGPKLPVLHRFRDGSYQSMFGGQPVRVIDAEISIATTAGRVTGVYRLITTLLDPGAYPATAIVRLYHERWERDHLLGDQVQHSRRPGSTRPHPGRRRPRDPRPAGHLPGPTHRDDRRHQRRGGRGPRPGQFHDRSQCCP
jgi:hypothetical protein